VSVEKYIPTDAIITSMCVCMLCSQKYTHTHDMLANIGTHMFHVITKAHEITWEHKKTHNVHNTNSPHASKNKS